MRSTRSLCGILGLGIAATLAGCSGDGASIVGTGTVGGDVSTGGNISIGGTASLGGDTRVGGTSGASSGGATSAGGTSNRGGSTALGGGVSTGGTASVAGNVSTNTGGSNVGGATTKATGGSSSPGGAATTGGKTGTGGTAVIATGGAAVGGAATGGAATGGAATGGAATGGATHVPTPPTSTANFPFPQNRQSANCVYPTAYSNDDVQRVYDAWKSALVVTTGVGSTCTSCRRVLRPAEPGLQVNSTVSEGIGYGMLIAVYMNDQPLFDDLWRYEQAHTWTYQAPFPQTGTAATSLMNWYIASDGTVATTANGGQSGSGAATDADEDMAFALIMADKQWKGGQGSLSKTYLAYAQQMVKDIWTYEIDQTNSIPKNGGGWGGIDCLNISYFAPSYYRLFATVGSQTGWSTVVTNVYKVISQSLNATNGNQTNGLVPAFSTSTGAADKCGATGGSTQKHWYQYDSCRTPFRIGIDACFNNSTDAKGYVAKTSSFFAPKGATGIVDGYELTGVEKPEFPGGTYAGLSAAFIGPAGVGAMSPQSGQNYQGFIDDVYSHLGQNNMWTGGQYYDESWTMISILMMSGNFLDYTKY